MCEKVENEGNEYLFTDVANESTGFEFFEEFVDAGPVFAPGGSFFGTLFINVVNIGLFQGDRPSRSFAVALGHNSIVADDFSNLSITNYLRGGDCVVNRSHRKLAYEETCRESFKEGRGPI